MMVNQAELAELLDVSTVTIGKWQEDPVYPLPVHRRGARGQEHQYCTSCAILWLALKRVREGRL